MKKSFELFFSMIVNAYIKMRYDITEMWLYRETLIKILDKEDVLKKWELQINTHWKGRR